MAGNGFSPKKAAQIKAPSGGAIGLPGRDPNLPKRLFQVVVMLQGTREIEKKHMKQQLIVTSESMDDERVDIRDNSQSMDTKQYEQLFIITKCTVLTMIMIFSSMTLGMSQYIRDEKDNELLMYCSKIAFNGDNFLNGICISMYFGFSDKIYKKGCCICDKCCLCCCRLVAKIAVKKAIDNDIELV